KKMGAKKKPFFRVVAADARSPRDGRFIELLGYYNPMTDPADLKFDNDKVFKWLDAGAEPTESVGQLLKKAGLLERWQLLKQGVKISELDSKIAERREKQPKPIPKEEKEAAKKKATDKAKAEAVEAEAAKKKAAAREAEAVKEPAAPEAAAEVKEKAETEGPKEEPEKTEKPAEAPEVKPVEQKAEEEQEEEKNKEPAEGDGAKKKE
ncbi:MAG: 30S ribosomal protein S16, partial [Candidatus Krumholzibacteria bacterium]|nr:30S ribosomal protein S16 [Candidatus Krumholzibacteria bacterium]